MKAKQIGILLGSLVGMICITSEVRADVALKSEYSDHFRPQAFVSDQRAVESSAPSLRTVDPINSPKITYSLVTYKSFITGKYWNMRVYAGSNVSLLIPDIWFSTSSWRDIGPSAGAPPWPGLRDDLIVFLVQWMDKGYTFYKTLLGYEPADNSSAPDKKLRIAFVTGLPAAGMGLIGTKGIEIGPHYLESAIYGALAGKVQQTIFWHELGRNFGMMSNDVGVKYVLVDQLQVPTFMGWEYGVSPVQFHLDQVYLLGRYFLADRQAASSGYLTNPCTKPVIPLSLKSSSLTDFYNGCDVKSAMAYQFWLENGMTGYMKLARYAFANQALSESAYLAGAVAFMNSNNGQGLSYDHWLKNGKWAIRSGITSGPLSLAVSQTSGRIGDVILLGQHNDTVTIGSVGQFRIDGGDGFDEVRLPFPSTAVIAKTGLRWKKVIRTSTSRIVLDFVEKVVFSDGVTLSLSQPRNSMFPTLRRIEYNKFNLLGSYRRAIRVTLSEPPVFKVPYDWGRDVQQLVVNLRTSTGQLVATYRQGDGKTVISGAQLNFVLPADILTLGKNDLYIEFWGEGGMFSEAVDREGNRVTRSMTTLPARFNFKLNTVQ